MKQYLELLKHVTLTGLPRGDRTGTGTTSVFGAQCRFDLQKGFPLLTTKKLHVKSILHELIWFLNGDTNVKYLQDNNVRIWNEWARSDGSLGPIYGKQWRSWNVEGGVIDQLAIALDQIKNNPLSRRIIVSAWNVGDLDKMALPPCHLLFQFYVRDEKFLDCQLYMRSADMFLGVPYNIASYSFLLHHMAALSNLLPGEFILTLGDAHVYSNHSDQCQLQLSRTPLKLPTLQCNRPPKTLEDLHIDSYELVGYEPYPHIAGKVAV